MNTPRFFVLLVVVGCGKHDGSSSAGASARLEYTALGDLGVEAEVPAGSVDPHRKNSFGTLTIETSPKLLIATEQDPKWLHDLAGTKQAIETTASSFQRFTKEETTAGGGFHLEYELTSSGGAASHGFTIRRRVGDKLYDCGTRVFEKTTVTTDQLASAIKICESLRAAGGTAAAAAPTKPAYSADAARQQLAALGTCTTDVGCAPLDTLVGFGESAGAELLAFAGDPGKPLEQRRLAAIAIGKIKVASAGPRLVELGNSIESGFEAGDFYEAAGACGGDATFDALSSTYDQQHISDTHDHLVELRRGLRAFPAKALAWATSRFPSSKEPTKYADVVGDVATEADRDSLIALVAKTKNPMARNRLASKAIQLGATDPKLFDVLIASLASSDEFDRSDAGNFLEPIANKIPADKKPKVIELVKKALASANDTTVARGLEHTLKALNGS